MITIEEATEMWVTWTMNGHLHDTARSTLLAAKEEIAADEQADPFGRVNVSFEWLDESQVDLLIKATDHVHTYDRDDDTVRCTDCHSLPGRAS